MPALRCVPQVLAHRLGLVPLRVDPRNFDFPSGNDPPSHPILSHPILSPPSHGIPWQGDHSILVAGMHAMLAAPTITTR